MYCCVSSSFVRMMHLVYENSNKIKDLDEKYSNLEKRLKSEQERLMAQTDEIQHQLKDKQYVDIYITVYYM